MNRCELQEIASMLGVLHEDEKAEDLQVQALDVLAQRVHAAEAGETFEAPVGWGTQISAADLAAFNIKPKEAPVADTPVLLGMDDLFADADAAISSLPSEQQPID